MTVNTVTNEISGQVSDECSVTMLPQTVDCQMLTYQATTTHVGVTSPTQSERSTPGDTLSVNGTGTNNLTQNFNSIHLQVLHATANTEDSNSVSTMLTHPSSINSPGSNSLSPRTMASAGILKPISTFVTSPVSSDVRDSILEDKKLIIDEEEKSAPQGTPPISMTIENSGRLAELAMVASSLADHEASLAANNRSQTLPQVNFTPQSIDASFQAKITQDRSFHHSNNSQDNNNAGDSFQNNRAFQHLQNSHESSAFQQPKITQENHETYRYYTSSSQQAYLNSSPNFLNNTTHSDSTKNVPYYRSEGNMHVDSMSFYNRAPTSTLYEQISPVYL